MGFIKKNIWFILLVGFILGFFWQVFAKGLFPIPSDTIVGLYHPFFDFYAKESPRGVPFHNFLITDPVRQIIPWKSLVIDSLSNLSLPLWNPYEMAGKPLLANFQSGTFYPFNLILFVKPFDISWSIFIILQPVLASIFMFAYLKNLKLDARAAVIGSAGFALGGFSIAWLEWGNIVHTALWLPLILLATDKIVSSIRYRVSSIIRNFWFWVLLASLVCSFFAGHLQVFFYIFIVSFAYLIFRWFEHGKKIKSLLPFAICYLLFALITFVQWYPTLQFINLSARSLDVAGEYLKSGWFLPWQHLIQFVAPDFFGNPATLNYWGVWNYGEFAGYVGAVGLFLAVLSIFVRKQRKEAWFFLGVILVSLLAALPNPISQIPFAFSFPFLSSSQPTRLIFLVNFGLAILSAFGLDALISGKINRKVIFCVALLFACIFSALWLVVLGKINLNIDPTFLATAKRNLILPSALFSLGIAAVLLVVIIKEELMREFLIVAIIALSLFDLFRFGAKFTPFTNPQYFYPQTKVIEFLQNQKGVFRIATTDSRILAPNIATYYKIQSIEGYDPLYMQWYAELIAASERDSHSIKPPFGFNRIITPRNTGSPVIDLLNVKYVLSFADLPIDEFNLVLSEGQTKVYQNKSVLPRAFFVKETKLATGQAAASNIFDINLKDTAIVSDTGAVGSFSKGNVSIESYGEERIIMLSTNTGQGFLVLSDSFYPTWKATIDGKESKIYKTNLNFRGIVVPKGNHIIEFKNNLL